MIGGPVTILRAKAAICPCLITPKESSASQAISAISSLPIQYYVAGASSSSDGGGSGVGKFVSSLFKGAANAASGGGDASMSNCFYKKGTLRIVDSLRGPTLFFETEKNTCTSTNDDEQNNIFGGDDDKVEKKDHDDDDMRITLKKIGEVAVYDSFLSKGNAGIAIYKKRNPTRGSSSNADQQKGAELIRFNVLSSNVFNDNDDENSNSATSEERDDVIENLRIAIEWDQQRRKNNPNEDQDQEDDEDGGASKKKSIALKAKYFVQREIEMKKQKKDREDRKARYLKDSGGLKYTALAMANREIS